MMSDYADEYAEYPPLDPRWEVKQLRRENRKLREAYDKLWAENGDLLQRLIAAQERGTYNMVMLALATAAAKV